MTQNLKIETAHFFEWTESSKVSEEITRLNVHSLEDPREIDELLNRNANRRWKHWEHGSGWAVVGVDPKTGEKVYDGAQFKPDIPVQRRDKNGELKFKRDGLPDLQKYFNASDYETVPLFLDTGIPDYWLNILNSNQRLIITEGPKKAGSALSAQEACISVPGISNGQRKGRLKPSLRQYCGVGRIVILGFDSDVFVNPNVCKAIDKLGRLIATYGAIVRVLNLPLVTKGIDDFIVANGYEAFVQLVEDAWTFEEWREHFLFPSSTETGNKLSVPEFAPRAEENYILRAQTALFSRTPYVSINGQLYRWAGRHYELQSTAVEKRRIAEWCRATAVQSGDYWEYKYATATHIENIYSWLLASLGVDSANVNPPGLNCLSGVLQISWQGNKPSWQVVPHNPQVIYTYVGEFEFDPSADPSTCDRLLSCLEPEQRSIFIQTLAASLDLQKIRYFRGRGIRALLCKGHGNNGKDSLREAVQTLYGIGVVGATVNDFLSYDQGRKFTLAKLEGARISWSSENSSFSQLDNLQSLKAAITGEPLDLERKNVDERQMTPSIVFLFNVNDAPSIQASLEAIQSRWAVLTFGKTFKIGADPKQGEIEADPRFRYDPNFLKKEVVPALLNKMLAALPSVAANAIDYSSTEQALQDIQAETNHLWSFVREVGVGYQVGGRIYVNDLWEMLRNWYLSNGTLEINTDSRGKEKHEWHEQPRRGDKNVKAANQVYQRFSELFPKISKQRDTSRSERTGQAYLAGIGFVKPNVEAVEANVEPNVEAVAHTQRHVEAAEPISPTLDYAWTTVNRLSPSDYQLFMQKVWQENGVREIGSAASTSDSQQVTASTTGSTFASTASTSGSTSASTSSTAIGAVGSVHAPIDIKNGDTNFFGTAPSIFKVGSLVAHKNPDVESYHWHGTILEINEPTAEVYWPERVGPKGIGGKILTQSLSDLRLI